MLCCGINKTEKKESQIIIQKIITIKIYKIKIQKIQCNNKLQIQKVPIVQHKF